MQDFLADGHKVKVTLQFRGREMAHPELGSRILDAVIEQVGSARQRSRPWLGWKVAT
jgi:translation initiation factor IF-3